MGDPRILRPVLVGLSIFLLEGAQAFAPPVQDAELQFELDSMANDTSRADGWKYHDLGEKTHCLTEFSNNASVLYRDAPTSSKKLLIYMEAEDLDSTTRPALEYRNRHRKTEMDIAPRIFLNETTPTLVIHCAADTSQPILAGLRTRSISYSKLGTLISFHL